MIYRKNVIIAIIAVVAIISAGVIFWPEIKEPATSNNPQAVGQGNSNAALGGGMTDEAEPEPHPMAISTLQNRAYPGGEFKIIEELSDGSNYTQQIVSYKSEGLEIRGQLTIPKGEMPEGGWPAVLFVHGYIPPDEYETMGNYIYYVRYPARNGFVVFKPDLRGHGQSEGEPVSAHFSEKYVVDSMFALHYLQNHPQVNPGRIGYWGHSNGGEIGLRLAVITDEFKAYSFWAGVVGSFEDHLETHNAKIPFLQDYKHELVGLNGLPSTNPEFWQTIDPYYHIDNISAPVELQHATGDDSVPIVLSQHLRDELEAAGKEVIYHEYQGDDHNIRRNVGTAWQRTIDFFEENL